MKLNKTIYNKLLLQAQEAKEQNMVKLANGILEAIGSYPETTNEEYSYEQLNNDIHKDLWKMATRLMTYYDVNRVNVEKLDRSLTSWADKIVNDLETTLEVSDVIKGPFDPKLPGEDK